MLPGISSTGVNLAAAIATVNESKIKSAAEESSANLLICIQLTTQRHSVEVPEIVLTRDEPILHTKQYKRCESVRRRQSTRALQTDRRALTCGDQTSDLACPLVE